MADLPRFTPVVGRLGGLGFGRRLPGQEPPEDLGDAGPADAQMAGQGCTVGELPRVEEALVESGQSDGIAPGRR
jgi:hypothetical protein